VLFVPGTHTHIYTHIGKGGLGKWRKLENGKASRAWHDNFEDF